MNNSYDIIIIGAGITGMYTAYWLEQLTDAKILIIEEHEIAFGASGRNAGFVTAGSPHHFFHLVETLGEQKALELWNYSQKSVEMTKKLIKELGVSLCEEGSIGVIEREEDREIFEKFYAYSQKYKLNAGWIDDSLFGKSMTIPSDGSTQVRDVLQSLAKKLTRTTFHYEKVLEIEQGKVTTEKEIFHCLECLVATNNNFFKKYFKIKTTPQRAQIQRLKMLGSFDHISFKNYYLAASRVYFRRINQDELLIGGLRMLDAEKEQTIEHKQNPIIQDALTQKASEILNMDVEVSEQWSGIMSFTPFELPIYEYHERLHFIGGFSGHGNGLAMLAAHNFAQNISLSTRNYIFPS